jgi:hypothetical protein
MAELYELYQAYEDSKDDRKDQKSTRELWATGGLKVFDFGTDFYAGFALLGVVDGYLPGALIAAAFIELLVELMKMHDRQRLADEDKVPWDQRPTSINLCSRKLRFSFKNWRRLASLPEKDPSEPVTHSELEGSLHNERNQRSQQPAPQDLNADSIGNNYKRHNARWSVPRAIADIAAFVINVAILAGGQATDASLIAMVASVIATLVLTGVHVFTIAAAVDPDLKAISDVLGEEFGFWEEVDELFPGKVERDRPGSGRVVKLDLSHMGASFFCHTSCPIV